MAEWSNPVPPMPSLRSEYRKFNFDTAPMPVLGVFVMSCVGATLWVAIMIPQMDGLVLRLIRIFKPPFIPYQCFFEFTPLETERQAVERMVYRTSLVVGHLFLLWPLFIISLLSLMEGILWMTGVNAPKYTPQLWIMSEAFMAVYLLCYYGDMVKSALMLGETRHLELVNITSRLQSKRWAPVIITTHWFELIVFAR